MKSQFILAVALAFGTQTNAQIQGVELSKPTPSKQALQNNNLPQGVELTSEPSKASKVIATPQTDPAVVVDPIKPSKASLANSIIDAISNIKQAPISQPLKQTNLNVVNNLQNQVIEKEEKGEINWTTQYITAQGQAIIDTTRFRNKAQAKLMARRGAVVVAQRNLLEIVKGVNVVGETTVKDFVTESDYVNSRVEGIVKGAVQVGQAVEKDGMIEVTLRMPIYGKNGIAPVMLDQANSTIKAKYASNDANQELETEPAKTPTPASTTLPQQIAFNVAGKSIDPSMFPVVLGADGKVQFDFAQIYKQTGQLPQIVKETKSVLKAFGANKAVELLDVVESGKGVLQLTGESQKKVSTWSKVGNTALTIGKTLLSIIL